MTKPPAIGFDFWTEGLPHSLDVEEQLAELRRESERRHSVYPRKVEQGAMTPLEAAGGQAIIDALVYDFQLGPPAREDGFTWAQKINALRGEIIRRRRNLPHQRERANELTRLDHERHLAALECAHARYWGSFGLNFMAGPGGERTGDVFADTLRAEIARRWFWAIGQGLDPSTAPVMLPDVTDWSTLAPHSGDRAALLGLSLDWLAGIDRPTAETRLDLALGNKKEAA